MRQGYEAPISRIDHDTIPQRVGEIGYETDAACRFAIFAYLAGLSRESPRDRLEQTKTVLLDDDQSLYPLYGLGRDSGRLRHVNAEVCDDLFHCPSYRIQA
ncbi:Hypothetical protein NGAL_HAMBI1146_00410 [Neorhizobium galegae bv. officinalis]|nr:Hypothetical protein NGAL_HAMBI1146_00410 [Neorhizobium galegae bv. officinalis]